MPKLPTTPSGGQRAGAGRRGRRCSGVGRGFSRGREIRADGECAEGGGRLAGRAMLGQQGRTGEWGEESLELEVPHAQRTRLEKPGEASRTRARCTHQHPTLCSAVPLGEGGWFVGAVRCWAVEHLTRRTRLYKRRLSPSSPFLTVCQRNISNAQLMNKATTISGVARVYLASDTNAPHQLGAACASHGRDSLPTFIGLKGRWAMGPADQLLSCIDP
ncbi:hypothetical protein BGZ61DRAFT_476159 [Ilyonectria robusta]|uniref:uncharacterized protein n=1 Tax=Ilyonectria robusta TaxID=1079257 RepID=UPI001E8E067A|nr:uncharacterized protein BGZ61DRAFT_476159 [Ilyonectria robusta]KAH8722269.1 hypothetical protein BGZ61DRAFT_476159 [Ilyonectria robusta]